MVFTGPVLYFAFTSSEVEKFFLDLFLFCSWTTSEIYLDNFFEVAHENKKKLNWATCIRAFRNGPNAKNDLKPTNAKNAHENEKNI